jgi:hypothetical protein
MLVSFASGRAAAADLTKIYVGYGGIAGYQMPLWVNKEAEIGKKYGVDIRAAIDQRRRARYAGVARQQHPDESELRIGGRRRGVAWRADRACRHLGKSHVG